MYSNFQPTSDRLFLWSSSDFLFLSISQQGFRLDVERHHGGRREIGSFVGKRSEDRKNRPDAIRRGDIIECRENIQFVS